MLEVGGGGGALTERLAPRVRMLHVVEIDERLRDELEPLAEAVGGVDLVWGDAMKVDLGGLAPAPTKMVANLPVLDRHAAADPDDRRAAVGGELGGDGPARDRRAAARRARHPRVRLAERARPARLRGDDSPHGGPRRLRSAAERRIRAAAASPQGLRRPGGSRDARPAGAFAHRRKSLARSLELARAGSLEPARSALEAIGKPPDARAETLSPEEFESFGGGARGAGGRLMSVAEMPGTMLAPAKLNLCLYVGPSAGGRPARDPLAVRAARARRRAQAERGGCGRGDHRGNRGAGPDRQGAGRPARERLGRPAAADRGDEASSGGGGARRRERRRRGGAAAGARAGRGPARDRGRASAPTSPRSSSRGPAWSPGRAR